MTDWFEVAKEITNLTPAQIDAAEQEWRDLVHARLKRELDAKFKAIEAEVDATMKRFRLDDAYQRDLEALANQDSEE